MFTASSEPYASTTAIYQLVYYEFSTVDRVERRGFAGRKREQERREKQETQEENEQRKVVEERKYGWEEKKRGEPGRSRGRRDSSRELRQMDNLKKREQREDKKIREGTMIIKALEIA